MTDSLGNSGLGTGNAQILPTYESKYGEEIARIKGAQQKQKNEREADIYGDLGKVNVSGIFHKHQPLFAQKQSDLYDWTKQNIDKLRRGDPQTTIDFHQKLTQLGTDIGESKNVRQSYEQAGKDYMANPDKYRPEAVDKLHEFEGYDKQTGQFQTVDPGMLQQNFDIEKDVRENALPALKDRFQEYGNATRNPITGVVETTEGKKLPDLVEGEDPRFSAAKEYLTKPHAYEQAHYEYMKAHPDSKPTADDLAQYVYETKGFKGAFPDFKKKHLTEGWKKEKGEGDELGASDITDITYTTPNPNKPGGVETVNTKGFNIPSNVTLNVDADEHVIDRNTKKSLKDANGNHYVGQLDIKGGTVGLDRVVRDGKETYVLMIFATSTNKDGEKIDIEAPISKVKEQKSLKHATGAIDALQKQADELNGVKAKPKVTPLTGSTIDPKTLIKDGYYHIKGKIYQWNGTKLIPQ